LIWTNCPIAILADLHRFRKIFSSWTNHDGAWSTFIANRTSVDEYCTVTNQLLQMVICSLQCAMNVRWESCSVFRLVSSTAMSAMRNISSRYDLFKSYSFCTVQMMQFKLVLFPNSEPSSNELSKFFTRRSDSLRYQTFGSKLFQ
jgi:hypothetical protein